MNSPIGIFDSGVGGLTVLRELIRLAPYEDVIYVADTIHMPYGNKSVQEIVGYMKQIVSFLERMNVKAILVACNTSSALALNYVKNIVPLPIVGLIEPTARRIAQEKHIRKVGVLATRATVSSLAYTLAIKRYNPDIQVIEKSAPLLVPFIENKVKREILIKALSIYLEPLANADIDTLILGCSHYPLYLKEISSILLEKYNKEINIIDPAIYAVEELLTELKDMNISERGTGKIRFFTTGDAYEFSEKATVFINRPIKAKHINLREEGEIKIWHR